MTYDEMSSLDLLITSIYEVVLVFCRDDRGSGLGLGLGLVVWWGGGNL